MIKQLGLFLDQDNIVRGHHVNRSTLPEPAKQPVFGLPSKHRLTELTNRQTLEGLTDLPSVETLGQRSDLKHELRQMIIAVYRYFYLVIVVHSFLINLFMY